MGTVYLIPSLLHEHGNSAIPSYMVDEVRKCQIFFVENERTARRYLKQLSRDIQIDDYIWYVISDELSVLQSFRQHLKEDTTIGIISEAGCPGVADPGQSLVSIAHEMNATLKPLVGPNSILLALMASGMNGQQFRFLGYLPIESQERIRSIKELEAAAIKENCTQIFIETPYRNNQLLDAIIKTCRKTTRLCIAVDLTSPEEFIRTKTIEEWARDVPDLHKRLAIFLVGA